MLVGPDGDVADRVAARFAAARVRVVRIVHAVGACERMAVAMPQVVVVLGTLRPDEREALTDRATAVGALVMDIDPSLDQETLDNLVVRAAEATIERMMRRDASSGAAGASASGAARGDEPPEADEDIDEKW